MTTTTQSISPLCQRMIDDMRLRKLSEKTQIQFIWAVKKFTRFHRRSPDQADAEDLRRFQLHMVSMDVSRTTINATITGMRFFFEVTLDRPELMKKMSPVRVEQPPPEILSADDVKRLLKAAPGIKYQAAFAVGYGAGLRAGEVVELKVTDIDRERKSLRVEQGKGRKDRYAMLSPTLHKLLRAQVTVTLATRARCFPTAGCFQAKTHQPTLDPPTQPRLPYRAGTGRNS